MLLELNSNVNILQTCNNDIIFFLAVHVKLKSKEITYTTVKLKIKN